MTQVNSAAPRSGVIAISWGPTGIGEVTLDGEHWASVEWSEKRQAWCIEDVEGRCLTHTASIRGQIAGKAGKDEAVALAEAMIRDGRMPDPQTARAEASERRRIARGKRERQPAQIKRREERQAAEARQWEAWREESKAQWAEEAEPPLYETLANSFDLADPELWKSNSFASLKPRLIVHVRAAIATLRSEVAYESRRALAQPFGTSGKKARERRRMECEHVISRAQARLDRALAIYRDLTGAEYEPEAERSAP
jgi:hypothetical protein